VTTFANSPALRRFVASLVLGGVALWPEISGAQAVSSFNGLASLPTVAWPQPAEGEESRWAGSYARMSTGFEVSSSKRSGSYAGPTIGFEGGRMWQDGNLLYGVVGGFDYLAAIGGGPTPAFGGVAYSRDFSGALQVKVGTLVTPDVLVYAKAGALALHEKLRFGATSTSAPFTREDIAVRPDARVGVEWAVTDRITLGLEAGVTGPALR
jgi:opacity protein-like surface antigen